MSSASRLRFALVVYTLTALTVVVVMACAALRYRPSEPAVVHLFAPPVADDATMPPSPDVLRVCADPNDLPYSNQAEAGYENAVASLVAADLHRRLQYAWRPQRRGFIRNTLKAGACDVVMGVPAQLEIARTTIPYYRSSYVFVTRRDRRSVRSLDDASLRTMKIGVQIVGEDYDNPPAVQALAERGLTSQVRGYTVYGDYARPEPQRTLIDDVVAGRVDTAIAWGPLAGYFARRSAVPLALTRVGPAGDATTPFVFDIAMAVRRDDDRLASALNDTIARRRADIRVVLERFGVPLVG
jgi:mxaJ protein